jgi:hypothetical protein
VRDHDPDRLERQAVTTPPLTAPGIRQRTLEAFISKPFTAAALMRKIAGVLNAP